MIKILILTLIPTLDILLHRIYYRINKGLYIDMYIPKYDREKIWEVVKND